MLMGIIQKPTYKHVFCMFEMPTYGQTMTLERLALMSYCTSLAAPHKAVAYARPQEVFKMDPLLSALNAKFQPLYVPEENICIDEFITVWKGQGENSTSI
jgi:hypothetical protein